MTTVLDALVITLGLDATAFTKGQRDVASSFARTKETVTKSSGEVEKSANDMADKLRKASAAFLELSGLFLGGRGFREVVQDIARMNTSLGNLGTTLGTSPQFIAAFSAAAERLGGSAGATMGSLKGLADSLTALRVEGKKMPDAFYRLEGASKTQIDQYGSIESVITGIATAASKMAQTDPRGANLLLRELGLDEATANLLIRQGPRMKEYIQTLEKLSPRPRDIAASQGLTAAWAELNQQFNYAATRIVTDLAPSLEALAEQLGRLFHMIGDFAQAHPHWVDGFTALLALFAGAKVIAAIKNIIALKDALLGLATANEASATGGLLGFLSANPWIAGLIAGGAVLAPTPAGGGEDERQRQRNIAADPDYYKPGHPGAPSGSGNPPLSGNDALRRRGTHGGDLSHQGDMPTGSKAGSLTSLIDEESKRAGIDPSLMRGIRAGESGHSQHYDIGDLNNGPAYGPFQLNVGRGRLGDKFQRETGLDLRDPKTIAAQARWVANYIAMRQRGNPNYNPGGEWFGYHPWDAYTPRGTRGESGYAPSPEATPSQPNPAYGQHRGAPVPLPSNMPKPEHTSLWTGAPNAARISLASAGAAHSAALSNIANSYQSTTTSSSNEMHVGTMNINAPRATDSAGIAKSIKSDLASSLFAANANFGLA